MTDFYMIKQLEKLGANIYFGGIHMTTNNNGSKFSFGNVTAPNGSIVIGDSGQAITYNTAGSEDAKKELLDIIASSSIPDESKEELTGAIEAITEEASKEKPNKLSLNGMMSGLSNAFSLFEKTPGLISAFKNWQSFFGGDSGTPPIS
ncbi:hypothetical protein [Paenibacillus sp. SI8]|uniref:hypothetical protein n=1 Tax=unclassified Paenibacillus TaxID=185978 RepID=UPI003466DDC7